MRAWLLRLRRARRRAYEFLEHAGALFRDLFHRNVTSILEDDELRALYRCVVRLAHILWCQGVSFAPQDQCWRFYLGDVVLDEGVVKGLESFQ